MSFKRLSTEVKQMILGYLDFISLLAIRNTNKVLRDMVNDSLAQPSVICPARAKLLSLYLDLHLYPSFRASRKHILPHLKPFSRSEYLEKLQAQLAEHRPNARIPEEFSLWILEWPEHAVIGWAWPGLDADFDGRVGKRTENGRWWRTYGSNALCLTGDNDEHNRLCWAFLDHEQPHESDSELLGLFVQYNGCTLYTVLYFDCGTARDGTVWAGREVPLMNEVADWHEMDGFEGSWVDWLRCELEMIEHQYS